MSNPLGWQAANTDHQHPFSLGFLVPIVIFPKPLPKSLLAPVKFVIPKLLKDKASNSCLCTFIASYQSTIRTKFLVPFDVELSFVWDLFMWKEFLSHKNELFAAVAVMYMNECICQKGILNALGFLFLLPIVLSALSSSFSFSLNQTHPLIAALVLHSMLGEAGPEWGWLGGVKSAQDTPNLWPLLKLFQ